jgi:hypothetical protein
MSALQDLIAAQKAKYQGGNLGNAFKIPEGKTKIRLLQKNDGEKFWHDVGVHWIKASIGGKVQAVVGCDDVTYDKPCKICTAIDLAKSRAMDAEEEALIKEWMRRKMVLVPGLVRSGDKASAVPVIIELTPTTFGNILSVAEEYSSAGVNMFSEKDGMDFVIERRGKGLDTEYTVMAAAKSDPVPAGTIDKLPDIDAYIRSQYFKGEEQKALNVIAQATGHSMAGIGVASVAGMLTNAKAEGADDEFATAATTTAKAAPAAKPVVETEIASESEIDDLMKELEDIG